MSNTINSSNSSDYKLNRCQICPAERATHGVEVFGAVGYLRRLANDALEQRGTRQLHLPQALVVSLVVT